MRKWFILLCLIAAQVPAIEVDFSRAGLQVLGKDTVRLRNVRVAGKTYYGDFRWQGEGLVLVAAGEDRLPMFSVTQRRYGLDSGIHPNLTQACMQEFGSFSRVADFQDLVAVTSDNLSLETLLAMLEETGEDNFFITYGRHLDDGRSPYFLTPKVPEEEQAREVIRLRGRLGVYASHRPIEGRVVCVHVRPQSNPFFDG